MAKVAFGFPAYDNRVYLDTLSSFGRTRALLEREGHGAATLTLGGSPYIDQARDYLVKMFLDSDCTHFMSIDADMGWDEHDVLKLLERDRNYVAGMYPHKKDEPHFTCRLALKDGKAQWDGDLVKADAVPAGFMLMKREVLERMWRYYAPFLSYEFQGQNLVGLNNMYLAGGKMVREDIAFGQRWSDIGDGIWIDSTVNLKHWDGRRVYAHKFKDYLEGTEYAKPDHGLRVA